MRLQRRPTRTCRRGMRRQGFGKCGSYVTTGNTTVVRRLSTTQTPGAASPSTPDTALRRQGPPICEFNRAFTQAFAVEEQGHPRGTAATTYDQGAPPK